MHSCHSCSSISHRALVTYANERTGEIRVKIPAVIGNNTEVSISRVGRHSFNNIWVVPAMGEQIIVSADDDNMTNVFWIHTDSQAHTQNYRNHIQVHDNSDQQQLTTAGQIKAITFNTVDFSQGISLVDGTKIVFKYGGVYNLQYSIQWVNTSSQINESGIWINYNGSPYPNSNTFTAITASHGGIPGATVTAVNIIGKAVGNGDYVELMWTANNTNVYIATAVGADFGLSSAIPAAPGVILTVTQVS